MSTTYIGVDLAWKSEKNNTGIVVLCGDAYSASIFDVSEPIFGVASVVKHVLNFASKRTIVAVDAPLIIVNQVGQRSCEKAVGNRYGDRDASCHSSNLQAYPDASSMRFASALREAGFQHGIEANATNAERTLIEVYPHAGMVALLDLPKILKYKKGTLKAKRFGLQSLCDHICRLNGATPALEKNPKFDQLVYGNVDAMRGREMKRHEDSLDALFAAYLALYLDAKGFEGCEIFGSLEEGYIVNPRLVIGGIA